MSVRSGKKNHTRVPEGLDPLLPLLSLLLLLLPIFLAHLSFSDLRVAETLVPTRVPSADNAQAPEGSVLFSITLGMNDHLTELVEESSGRRLSQLRLLAGKTAPTLLRTEFRRLQRKYPRLDTILIRTAPDLAYGDLVAILAGFSVPNTDRTHSYRDPKLVLVPGGT